jgi:predicted phage-related endonuclease
MDSMKTKPKATHGTDEWLWNRFRNEMNEVVFGYSDSSALMGVSPYKSRYQLYKEKMTAPVVVEETWAMRKGNIMEPLLVVEMSRVMGVEMITPEVVYTEGRWVGSLDCVPARSVEEPEFIGEIKVTGKYTVNGAGDLPQEWLTQGHMQSKVCGCPVFFGVFDKRQNFNVIEMPYDKDLAEKINDEAERIGEMIDKGVAPSEEFIQDLDSEDIAGMFPAQKITIELPVEAENFLRLLEIGRETKALGEQQEKEAKDALARYLKDAEVGTLYGRPAISWKQTAGRESLDTKALKDAHPDLVKQFLKQGNPFRTMRIMTGGKSDE